MNITRKHVIKWAIKQGYNISFFLEYLKYQEENQLNNKWSLESFAIANPNEDCESIQFLDHFACWMGWGRASCIPDTHSFAVYCETRDIMMHSQQRINVIYDKEYLSPGYVIFLEDCSKFLKLYYDNNMGFNNYRIRAYDGTCDTEEDFRKIVFSIDESDPKLYSIAKTLYEQTRGEKIETLDRAEQGCNHFYVEKCDSKYNLVAVKDVYGVKRATDYIDIYLGDEISCKKQWMAINEFYRGLGSVANPSIKNEVKLLALGIYQR